MTDFPRLLEDVVSAVQRESDEIKRLLYPTFLLNIVGRSPESTQEQRSYLLEVLESLSLADIEVLAKFEKNADVKALELVGEATMPATMSPYSEQNYERRAGPIMISTSKLEARGILTPVPSHVTITDGSPGEWYRTYARKCWKIMPIGRMLIEALKEPGEGNSE